MCTKGRDVIDASLWLAPTGNSWFTGNNCKPQSLPQIGFSSLPVPIWGGHVDLYSVALVQPSVRSSIPSVRPHPWHWIAAYCHPRISVSIGLKPLFLGNKELPACTSICPSVHCLEGCTVTFEFPETHYLECSSALLESATFSDNLTHTAPLIECSVAGRP